MSKPSAPTPPNPYATAAAQTGTNVSTAVANAFLNNPNQVTPSGTLNYSPTGAYDWTDPSTGSTYHIPTFTATTSLSPQEQDIFNQSEVAKGNLAGLAATQSGKLANLLASPFDTSGAPSGGDPSSITGIPGATTSFDRGGNQLTSFDPGWDITKSYGPQDNFSADRSRVEDALMARINPQLDRQRSAIEQRLADQGIRYGSQAYTSAMDDYNRQANDARFAAIGQAGTEQQRLAQMAQAQAQFQNQAQEQGYEQNLGQAGFTNQALGAIFGQNQALGTFQNAGLAQQVQQAQAGFNASQAARNAYLQQAYAQRNQPINEITALLSGSQVTQPNFVNTNQSQIPTTDFAGIQNQNFQNQMGIYNAQNQNYQSLMGGILGLGAGALKLSDEREKKDIKEFGSVFSTNEAGERTKLPIYQYSYKKDPASVRHIGPMAQDVEKQDPSAVRTISNRKYLDASKVMGNILRAA